MIYADNAATTKLDKDALEAMIPWLQDEYGNASQPYSFSRKKNKGKGGIDGMQVDELLFFLRENQDA